MMMELQTLLMMKCHLTSLMIEYLTYLVMTSPMQHLTLWLNPILKHQILLLNSMIMEYSILLMMNFVDD